MNNDWWDYLAHSAKGTTWESKDHKYKSKTTIGGKVRYFYEDITGISAKNESENAESELSDAELDYRSKQKKVENAVKKEMAIKRSFGEGKTFNAAKSTTNKAVSERNKASIEVSKKKKAAEYALDKYKDTPIGFFDNIFKKKKNDKAKRY